jgi:S1-C subfamily serine protease
VTGAVALVVAVVALVAAVGRSGDRSPVRVGGRSTGTVSGPASAIAAAVSPAVVDITASIPGGEAAGTGMVISADGLVLTNNHVIADGSHIKAQPGGAGRTYDATVLGYDTTADVALLQLSGAHGLATVTIGDSASVRVRDAVVALGNALGRGGPPAVTSGVVTALDQTITVSDETGQNQETLSGLIEIDGGLQPGDSGGPLLDAQGRVIGMDTAGSGTLRNRPSTDGYAIAIDDAVAIARQIEDGRPSAEVHIGARGLLGVEISPASRTALVSDVPSGTPADEAGISSGATIVGIDDTKVTDGASLRSALDAFHPGDHVTVHWTDRSGTSHSAEVALTTGPPA